jgi:hypothetical protein
MASNSLNNQSKPTVGFPPNRYKLSRSQTLLTQTHLYDPCCLQSLTLMKSYP